MTPTPREYFIDVAGQLLLARALAIAVDLGIAEQVASGPKSMVDLAAQTGCDSDALYRMLRMLGGHGIFAEDDHGRIKLTPRAELLQADHPDSVHDMFALGWQDIHWSTYQALPEAVLTGETAFEIAYGQDFFDYLAAHRGLNDLFDRRMASVSHAENKPIAKAYPFADFSPIVDIGGGQGGLLAAIVEHHPGTVVALFEQPQVLSNQEKLSGAGSVARVAGDFFSEVPPGFVLYVLKRIIHDWDDERAIGILRRCSEAMGDNSRVLVIDAVMKPGNDPDPNKNLDLGIMALTPGRERTEAEFADLFTAAGLRLTRVISTESPSTLSIVEGERVGSDHGTL